MKAMRLPSDILIIDPETVIWIANLKTPWTRHRVCTWQRTWDFRQCCAEIAEFVFDLFPSLHSGPFWPALIIPLLIYLLLDFISLVFLPYPPLDMSSSPHLQNSVLFTPEDDRDMLDSLKGLSIKGFHDWYHLFVTLVHGESSHISL